MSNIESSDNRKKIQNPTIKTILKFKLGNFWHTSAFILIHEQIKFSDIIIYTLNS